MRTHPPRRSLGMSWTRWASSKRLTSVEGLLRPTSHARCVCANRSERLVSADSQFAPPDIGGASAETKLATKLDASVQTDGIEVMLL
ncbi:hypothetical protein PybrP1_012290 [[Pythium] brassicae (nom. inval.)]|nr:hypothetical protein PybrP1_012290 [[Pythium] brassicae (nom. inval.)]